MKRRGFTYYDRNVSSADTQSGATARSISRTVLEEVASHSRSIVLFHDSERKNEYRPKLSTALLKVKGAGDIPLTAYIPIFNRSYLETGDVYGSKRNFNQAMHEVFPFYKNARAAGEEKANESNLAPQPERRPGERGRKKAH
jgi:hypothetical protein